MLLDIFKKLYIDLSNHKIEAMNEFGVEWTHINIKKLKLETPLDMLLSEKMCEEVAKGIHAQEQ